MVTYSLDTSAVLRLVDREAGADRVEAILDERDRGFARVVICAIHWSEIIGVLLRRTDPQHAASAISKVRFLSLEVVPVPADRAERAAHLRQRYRVPFVDSFGLELVHGSAEDHLMTADFDLKPATQDCNIEFLPQKPKP